MHYGNIRLRGRRPTYRDGFAMNLVRPASIVSQCFNCGQQIYKICHEKHFARVQTLKCLINRKIKKIISTVHHDNKIRWSSQDLFLVCVFLTASSNLSRSTRSASLLRRWPRSEASMYRHGDPGWKAALALLTAFSMSSFERLEMRKRSRDITQTRWAHVWRSQICLDNIVYLEATVLRRGEKWNYC